MTDGYSMRIEDFKRSNDADIFFVEGSVPLLKYHILEELNMVEHGFTTRKGGVSTGDYASLNLSFTRGDEEAAVRENYKRVAKSLHRTENDFVCSDQTHTTNVLRVTKEHAGLGVTREKTFKDVDGLITNEPGIVLSTFYADCVPLFLVDPIQRAIGLSHSGWRGTVGRMGKVTIEAMTKEFGSKPEDIIAAIGPSICMSCYEVSEDVAFAFTEEFKGHEEEILLSKGNGKYLLDLWKCNEIVLREAGVTKEHLKVTNICTCCNEKLLFSHRASGGKRGNLGAFLSINE